MPFCKNCGKEINQEAKFCMNCGFALMEDSSANEDTSTETYIPKSIDDELLSPLRGKERIFTLCNHQLVIPEDMDLYNAYRTKFREMAQVCSDNAIHEYLNSIHDFDTFISLFMGIYEKHLEVLTKKAFDILIAEDIYNITYEDFYNHHKANCHYALNDYNAIVESCRLTENNNKQLHTNVGSGIQSILGGYIDKKSTYGVVNSFMNGYIEGAINQFIENGTAISAEQKAELYNRITPHLLFNKIYHDYWNVFASLTYQLKLHRKKIFFPMKESIQQSNNIFKNLSNPNFNQNKLVEVLFDVIKGNPYNAEYYKFLENKFGSTDEVKSIVAYFGYNIDELIYKEEDYPKTEKPIDTSAADERQGNNSVLDKLNVNPNAVTNMIKTGIKSGFGKGLSGKFGKFF